jgi:hypothetical protein
MGYQQPPVSYLAILGLEGRALKPGSQPSWLPALCLALSAKIDLAISFIIFSTY